MKSAKECTYGMHTAMQARVRSSRPCEKSINSISTQNVFSINIMLYKWSVHRIILLRYIPELLTYTDRGHPAALTSSSPKSGDLAFEVLFRSHCPMPGSPKAGSAGSISWCRKSGVFLPVSCLICTMVLAVRSTLQPNRRRSGNRNRHLTNRIKELAAV